MSIQTTLTRAMGPKLMLSLEESGVDGLTWMGEGKVLYTVGLSLGAIREAQRGGWMATMGGDIVWLFEGNRQHGWIKGLRSSLVLVS